DAALHDRQLGLPGAYEKAAKAVGLLQAAGVPVGVNCVISAMNYKVLPEVAREFSGRGVRRFSFFGLRYIGHAALPGNLSLLRVAAVETVPYLREALGVLKTAGALEGTYVNDYTPCQLPEYVDRLADWERGANCDSHSDPDGRTAASEEVCSEGKTLMTVCGECVYKD